MNFKDRLASVGLQMEQNRLKLYEQYLEGLAPKKILLLGVNSRQFIRVWIDSFPEAEIYGLVGDEGLCGEMNQAGDRVFFLNGWGSSAREKRLLGMVLEGGGFDLVIDGGISLSSEETLPLILNRMSLGGILLLEDPSVLGTGSECGRGDLFKKCRTVLEEKGEVHFKMDPFSFQFLSRVVVAVFSGKSLLLKLGIRALIFDEEYYLGQNPDVKSIWPKTALDHFLEHGAREKRPWRFQVPRITVCDLG